MWLSVVCWGGGPQVKVIGVEPADANAMALSLHHERRVQLSSCGTFADGVAVRVVGEETFRICQELVDGVVLVSRDAICAAIKVTGTALRRSPYTRPPLKDAQCCADSTESFLCSQHRFPPARRPSSMCAPLH